MVNQFLEHLTRLALGDTNLVEIAAVTKPADQFHQCQTPLQRHASVRMRAADEILDQQRFAVEVRRQKQTRAVALPAFSQSTGSSHGPQLFKDFFPTRLRLATLEIHARCINQPGVVIKIKIAAERVEPFKKHSPRVRFLFQHEELIVRLRQLLN